MLGRTVTPRFIAALASIAGCASQGEAASPSVEARTVEPSLPAGSQGVAADAGSFVQDSAPSPDADAASAPDVACLPNGTVLNVTADHVTAYVIDGADDPQLTLCRGMTYTFRIDAPFHPFLIKTEPTLGTSETFDERLTNNGTEAGDVVFVVQKAAPALLHYICEYPDGRQGGLRIRD